VRGGTAAERSGGSGSGSGLFRVLLLRAQPPAPGAQRGALTRPPPSPPSLQRVCDNVVVVRRLDVLTELDIYLYLEFLSGAKPIRHNDL
jgi:hypothetical protein